MPTAESTKADQKLRALIIDDERPARELIETLLSQHREFEVIGECGDGREAVSVIRKLKPDLIFLDVRMPHLDGFEVLERLDSADLPIVVFVTAYDQYAVRAFEVNALDYLLKPIRRQRFVDAVARARDQLQHHPERHTQKLRRLLQHWKRTGSDKKRFVQSEYLQRIFVKDRRKSVSVEVSDVDWIGSSDHFVEIHLQGRRYLLHEKLSNMEEKLDPAQFFRIHRTKIVNLAAIREFSIGKDGGYHTVLRDGTSHRVARSRRTVLQTLLA